MATIKSRNMDKQLDRKTLNQALELLSIRLEENAADSIELVVCGGSALILSDVIYRLTKDVDVVALARKRVLYSPAPLPDDLRTAVVEVAEDLGLADNWLNNGPSQGEGGLFQMGLPEGFSERLHSRSYGSHLIVHFIDRLDQIHFKLYAAVDTGGYHVEDLRALKPTSNELESAARWSMTHDVSRGYAFILKEFIRKFGYDNIADRL
ncbi:MAG: DUF6036 family nucleotidyltransferase [Candidatus Auribacterota bacterium]|nr:DUF6036 family nucleotidyltransferase [Candidatus Auribacterota bacterium]